MGSSTEWIEVTLSVSAWYLTSFGTLLLNKHLLGTRHVQPNTLAAVQMVSTAVYGALKTVSFRTLLKVALEVLNGKRDKLGSFKEDPEQGVGNHRGVGFCCSLDYRQRRGLAQMGLVGGMRFATVLLGLVSLKHVAASFTETIKASAPFFTVGIAYFMLGETTTPLVVMSLLPVAGGLVMVSYSELSFNMIGFGAAVATNVIECIQNVFSKRLLVREYTASELQFYTSLTALVLQAPLLAFNAQAPAPERMGANETLPLELRGGALGPNASDDGNRLHSTDLIFGMDSHLLLLLWVDGVLYHAQSVVAYIVMSYLSPVTVSVVNTLKRALLIWISVLVFGNMVTSLAKLGTGVCLIGALCYNIARQQKRPSPETLPTSGAGGSWKTAK